MEKNIFKNSNRSRFGISTIFFGIFVALFLAVVVNSFMSENNSNGVVRSHWMTNLPRSTLIGRGLPSSPSRAQSQSLKVKMLGVELISSTMLSWPEQ